MLYNFKKYFYYFKFFFTRKKKPIFLLVKFSDYLFLIFAFDISNNKYHVVPRICSTNYYKIKEKV